MATSHQPQEFLNGAKVAPEIFQLRPDYRALLMVVDGIRTAESDDVSEALLQEAEHATKTQRSKQGAAAITEWPHIAAWRNTYKAFGAKPNKTRNSLEALTRRAEKGLPRVNRLTDIYNAISVKHQIPFGGEDLDQYSGPPSLIRATGNEKFETRANGDTAVEHPEVGEVVWMDGNYVTCRHWNWRQSPRTALTDETTRALFIIDALGPVSDDALNGAADELASALNSVSSEVQVFRRVIGPPE